ncbi:MAG TPA: hypothetical protein VGH89_27270 [Pseudonocardia sp.]|jgi:hypothetical protein
MTITSQNDDQPLGPYDYEAAAKIIARWPDVCAGLLQRHQPDRDGRCLGCRSATHGAPHAPCRLRQLAERAHALNHRPARIPPHTPS